MAARTLALDLSDRLVAPAASTLARNIGLVLLGSWIVAGLAQLSIPLGFTPVPITGQTLGVLLVGAALGSRRGGAALLAYLVQGAMGLPFFQGGTGGPAVLAGPTAGYLYGFVVAAFVVGWMAERSLDRRFATAMGVFLAGSAIIFACGLVWLAAFVGPSNVLAAGLWPFLPGAVIKAALAAMILPSAWKLLPPQTPSTR